MIWSEGNNQQRDQKANQYLAIAISNFQKHLFKNHDYIFCKTSINEASFCFVTAYAILRIFV